MNYFEIFDLKPSYNLNQVMLENKYRELQKKYHPDNADSIDEQLAMVEQTIKINEAYDILSDEVSLIVYYLKINNNLELSQGQIQDELSQDDLMYLLDLQENIVNNPLKTNEYKLIFKEKISSIILSLKQAIQIDNKAQIINNLAKLIFFNKSFKHIG
jgi:molecular chaperone HscB